MNEIIVSMENICKTFPGVKALDHVKFELRSGEVMVTCIVKNQLGRAIRKVEKKNRPQSSYVSKNSSSKCTARGSNPGHPD